MLKYTLAGMAALAVAVCASISTDRAAAEEPASAPSVPAVTAPAQPQQPLSNQLVIRTRPGTTEAALAGTLSEAGARSMRPVGFAPDMWLVYFADATAATAGIPAFTADSNVVSVDQERTLKRSKKTTDLLFGQQWHLVNGTQVGEDLNVSSAWATGRTGTGVKVCLIDDGLDRAHEDIAANYDAANSTDVIDNDADPAPSLAADNHGTACGGLIAAVANNSLGGAGVAYGASLAAVRMVSTTQTDTMEGIALAYNKANIHVYSNSWGPDDNQGTFVLMGNNAYTALRSGVTTGRGNLGAIYVWAAGNGRASSGVTDNVNEDGYANRRETIAVAALGRDGTQTSYSENGACLVVSAFGSENDEVVTTDRTGAAGYNTTGAVPNLSDTNYTNDFSGTSAAAPQVSGVVALMLQANPGLSWRDVQHILIRTARKNHPADTGWINNKALSPGYHFNHKYGAGCVDAGAAVALAATWPAAPADVLVSSAVDPANTAIPDNQPAGIVRAVAITSSIYCEHVEVTFTSSHPAWQDLNVTLTSPQGTVSQLAVAHISTGAANPPSNSWTFMTTRCWGEQAQGNWQLNVSDTRPGSAGSLGTWRVDVHGTTSEIGPTGQLLPTINTTTPNPVKVGQDLTINGANLTGSPSTVVTIGGVSQPVKTPNASALVITVAAGTPTGLQVLSVTTGAGTASRAITVSKADGTSSNPNAGLYKAYLAGGKSSNCSLTNDSGPGLPLAVLFGGATCALWFLSKRKRRRAEREQQLPL